MDIPSTDIWSKIRYFESQRNVADLLSGNIASNRATINLGPTELAQKSAEISACIKQANEYNEAAKAVGLATKPLLLFYSTQVLAKAVILANNVDIGLSDLKYHGLSTRASTVTDPSMKLHLQSYSNDPSSWRIENEYAVSNEGVFLELCKTIGDTGLNPGISFTFQELIRIIPDLSDTYRRHYSETSHCFGILTSMDSINSEGKYEVYFSDLVDMNDVKSAFPEFDNINDFEEVQFLESDGFCSVNPMSTLPFGKIEKTTLGNRNKYMIRPLDCGIHKSLSILFAALFILSNIVRYKPSFWMVEMNGISSGSVAIVEDLCNLALRRVPIDVLESMYNEEIFVRGM
jgi:hypothetical protein